MKWEYDKELLVLSIMSLSSLLTENNVDKTEI